MTALIVMPATIVVRDNARRQWLCPWCRKVLADVTPQTVLIKHDWRIAAIARPEHVKMTCRCRQDSYVDAEVLAG